MEYQTEVIDAAGRARLAQLDLRIEHRKPNSTKWTIDRAAGDFLIWIYPDRDPPHWTTYGFYWRGAAFNLKVAMSGDFTNRATYSVMSVRKERANWDLAGSEAEQFCSALTAAMECYCRDWAQEMAARKFQDTPAAINPVLHSSRADLSRSPALTINIEFPGQAR